MKNIARSGFDDINLVCTYLFSWNVIPYAF